MKSILFVFACLSVSVSVQAQTSTTSTSIPAEPAFSAVPGLAPSQESHIKLSDALKNKKFEDDKDITDAKLKADEGSLSRYSLKFTMSYAGPPVGDLSNQMQPNPDGAPGTHETSLGGSMGARYRIDKKSAVNIGTGVSMLTPVQGAKRYDVKNPFFSYDRSARVFDIQMRNSFGGCLVTNPDWRKTGETSCLTYDDSLVYNLGTSGFAVGVDTSLAYYMFERGIDPHIKKEKKGGRYNLSFYPQVKYNFTDKLNLYTSLAVTFFNPRDSQDNTILYNNILSQRLGMGYAFTRDIYFAPYLNFYTNDMRADSTTVNFSTTFSIL